jgi:hypothetical protein
MYEHLTECSRMLLSSWLAVLVFVFFFVSEQQNPDLVHFWLKCPSLLVAKSLFLILFRYRTVLGTENFNHLSYIYLVRAFILNLPLYGTCNFILGPVCTVAVFRIHDILEWIRIRIRGSMPLTNVSGSCFFRQGP